MYCDECKVNKANIHYTNIINGKKKEMHLCSECGKKLESMGGFKFINDSDFFLPFLSLAADAGTKESKVCPSCGTRLSDFQASGYLGCPQCYIEFQSELSPIIRRVQGGAQKHIGKIPKGSGVYSSVNEFERLSSELKRAVEDERYEEAAAIRDKLKKFR